MNKLDREDLDKGSVFVPYVMETTSTSINGTAVWYKNRWKKLWLKIKFFFRKPKDLKDFEKYYKKHINSKFYQEIKIAK